MFKHTHSTLEDLEKAVRAKLSDLPMTQRAFLRQFSSRQYAVAKALLLELSMQGLVQFEGKGTKASPRMLWPGQSLTTSREPVGNTSSGDSQTEY